MQCNSGLPLSAELRLSLEREGGNKFYCPGPPGSYLGLNNRQPSPHQADTTQCHSPVMSPWWEPREENQCQEMPECLGFKMCHFNSQSRVHLFSQRVTGVRAETPWRSQTRPGKAGSPLPVIEKFDQIWFSCGRAGLVDNIWWEHFLDTCHGSGSNQSDNTLNSSHRHKN